MTVALFKTARQRAGAVAGPTLFAATLAVPTPFGLVPVAWHVAGLVLWMAAWWITEATPLAVTALLPIVVVPLIGAGTVADAAAPFANPLIFLFLGGFAIALAMERAGLCRRVALMVLMRAGDRPAGILAGFMIATAFVSMWVSNTATALMMVPIALSVVDLMGEKDTGRDFAPALLLGVAYAASLGGMATLVGTPPNAVFAAFAERSLGVHVGFAHWMAVGVPVAAMLTALTWLVLARVVFRLPDRPIAGSRARIGRALAELGPWHVAEHRAGIVALVTAGLWVTGPLYADAVPATFDTIVALGATLVLFLTPAGNGGGRLLTGPDVRRLPWDVLLLIGGGLSLGTAMESSGLADAIGRGLAGLGALPWPVAVLAIAVVVVFVSELASNTATAAAFLPVVAALAPALGVAPLSLVAGAALAASAGFMLPVATPSNAIAYATGRVGVGQMAKAGFLVDLAAAGAALLGFVLAGAALGG